jgi:general secretion pathway protein D
MIVEVSGGDAGRLRLPVAGPAGQSGDKTGLLAAAPTDRRQRQRQPSDITGRGRRGRPRASPRRGPEHRPAAHLGGTTALAALAAPAAEPGQTNIVSTPNLITLDNEEAKIVVGENVPFITGQFTNTGTATTSPFQTIERKDVGITLRIKPQIGEGGTSA